MSAHLAKIGLLGGSFNPFHNAHLRLAQTALTQLDLDEVQLIPAGQPWQKKPLSVSSEHRLNMLKLATRYQKNIRINPIEIERNGPSYTIDTVSTLPLAHYYWLMGTDQLNNFCSWKDWQAILKYVQLTVVKRPGYEVNPPTELLTELQQHHQSLVFLDFDEMDLSSTIIRQAIKQGKPVDDFIHPDVVKYIQQHKLYQDN